MTHGNLIFFKNRQIGHREKDVFVTSRRPEHVMVKFKGFGISMAVLEFLIGQLKIKKVRVEYSSELLQRSYEFDILDFVTSKHKWTDKTTDGTDDLQKFVSLDEQDWSEICNGLPFFQKQAQAQAQARNQSALHGVCSCAPWLMVVLPGPLSGRPSTRAIQLLASCSLVVQ